MSWTQAELDALKNAFASRSLRVSYDGRSVEYGSASDLLQRIRTIAREMATEAGAPKPSRILATFRKG